MREWIIYKKNWLHYNYNLFLNFLELKNCKNFEIFSNFSIWNILILIILHHVWKYKNKDI